MLPANTWSHLAAACDGLTLLALRQRHPGRERRPPRNRCSTSASPLRIGGNSVWGEWFAGLIDEVRVYNRALTASDTATDRDTAISGAGRSWRRAHRAAAAEGPQAHAADA